MIRILLTDDCAPSTVISAADEAGALEALLGHLDDRDRDYVRDILAAGTVQLRSHPYRPTVSRESDPAAFWSAVCDIATGGTQDWRFLREGEAIDD